MTDQPTAAERIITDALRDMIIMGLVAQGTSFSNARCVQLVTEYLKRVLSEKEFKAHAWNRSRNTGRLPIKTMIAEGLMEPEHKRSNGVSGKVVVVTIKMVRDMISLRWNLTKLMMSKLCLAPAHYEWTPGILLKELSTSDEHLTAIEERTGASPYVGSQDDVVAQHILNHMKCIVNTMTEIAKMSGLSILIPAIRTSANYPRMYRQRLYKQTEFILTRMKAVNKEWKDIIDSVTKCRAEPNNKARYMKVQSNIDVHFAGFLETYFGDPSAGDEYIEPTDCAVLQFPSFNR